MGVRLSDKTAESCPCERQALSGFDSGHEMYYPLPKVHLLALHSRNRNVITCMINLSTHCVRLFRPPSPNSSTAVSPGRKPSTHWYPVRLWDTRASLQYFTFRPPNSFRSSLGINTSPLGMSYCKPQFPSPSLYTNYLLHLSWRFFASSVSSFYQKNDDAYITLLQSSSSSTKSANRTLE